MEELNEVGETLMIKDAPKKGGGGADGKTYELIPEGVYEAEYTGLKTVEYLDPKWGQKKKARLLFRITRGAMTDRKTSYSSNLYRNKETGEFFIGSDSELAKCVKVVTKGSLSLDDSHKGNKVLIEITHQQNKDKTKTWDFATNVMKIADEAPAPAKAPAAAPAAAAKPAAAAPAPAAKPASDLLTDITDLGDFKL